MATTLKQNKLWTTKYNFALLATEVDRLIFGERVGFLGKIFGCWHGNLSRPFSQSKIAYRSCLECGARKQFNKDTLETFGNFYYPPIIKADNCLEI